MKKAALLAAALAMVLSLAACGNRDDSTPDDPAAGGGTMDNNDPGVNNNGITNGSRPGDGITDSSGLGGSNGGTAGSAAPGGSVTGGVPDSSLDNSAGTGSNGSLTGSGNDTGTGWNDEIVPDTVFKGFLTVEEAATAEVGSLINVRGYIVGSTSRNIYNAIVRPPFESRTSLILADKRLTEVEAFYEDDLFPVRLTDYKDTQRALNLVDNPEHWNKRVYIFGQKCSYMGMPGLEKIMKYEFIE